MGDLDADTWQRAVIASTLAAELLKGHALADLIAAGERSQAIGPLLEPSLWRAKNEALAQDLVVLRAAQTFVATIEAERRKAQERAARIVGGLTLDRKEGPVT